MSDAAPVAPASSKIDVGASITYGWEAFKKYPGPLILAFLVVWIGSGIVTGIGYAFNSIFLQVVINIIGSIVAIMLAKGLVTIVLDITQGREPDLAKLFTGENLLNYIIVGIIVGLAVGFGLLFCIVPGLFAIVALHFAPYRVIDRGETPMEALSGSWELVKPQFGSLVVLILALFAINIVGALLCLVGLLVTSPLSAVAMAHAYRTASGEQPAAL
jgi:uncharacterized membrane protein